MCFICDTADHLLGGSFSSVSGPSLGHWSYPYTLVIYWIICNIFVTGFLKQWHNLLTYWLRRLVCNFKIPTYCTLPLVPTSPIETKQFCFVSRHAWTGSILPPAVLLYLSLSQNFVKLFCKFYLLEVTYHISARYKVSQWCW